VPKAKKEIMRKSEVKKEVKKEAKKDDKEKYCFKCT